jgi:hypothetical protein
MAPTAAPDKPAARTPVTRRAPRKLRPTPPTPPVLQKRKMTLAEAAEQWEKAKRDMQAAKALLDEAAPVLLDYFERTNRPDYKKRVGWNWTGGGVVLDQGKVRAFLGARLAEFQTRSRRSRSLTLLR